MVTTMLLRVYISIVFKYLQSMIMQLLLPDRQTTWNVNARWTNNTESYCQMDKQQRMILPKRQTTHNDIVKIDNCTE